MKRLEPIVVALVLALAATIPTGTAFAVGPLKLPNGFTAKVVAHSGQTIHGRINAAGYDLGVYIGPGVHDVKVVGAMVRGANDEGILVQDASDILIKDSTIKGNAVNPYAGLDEAKGIVLAGTTNVRVENNAVESNQHGGISILDDGLNSPFAPVAIDTTPVAGTGNVITGNSVKDNANGCGIVLSAKNPGGGVSNNAISSNAVTGGVGGIVIAGGAAGPVSVTDNTISNNVVTGSLIPGISLHAFGPGVILGTQLIGNVLSNNGSGGISKQTTGVEIFAVKNVGTIKDTQVVEDSVSNDYYGVFHLDDTDTYAANLTTHDVTVPVGP